VPSVVFLFVLLGLNCLQSITGFRNMREIELRDNLICGMTSGRGCASMLGLMALLNQPLAHFICFIPLERAGVCFAPSDAEFRKNVENRARLDFKLFREIVDSNLAHPPLFASLLPTRRLQRFRKQRKGIHKIKVRAPTRERRH
jgi:hypothetical protein